MGLELDTKVNIAVFVSLISMAFNIWLYGRGRKLEKVRFYDRVYDAACWLLMYEHRRIQSIEFTSEDKELEAAVRQFSRAHGVAQMWGGAFELPERLKGANEEGVYAFNRLVSDTYYAHERAKHGEFWNGTFSQSPVFVVNNEECREKFDWLMKTIGENQSYFSKAVQEKWQRAQETTIAQVHGAYESFNKILGKSCDGLDDERVDDPYLELLLIIRSEYRQMTKTLYDRIADLTWPVRFRGRRIWPLVR